MTFKQQNHMIYLYKEKEGEREREIDSIAEWYIIAITQLIMRNSVGTQETYDPQIALYRDNVLSVNNTLYDDIIATLIFQVRVVSNRDNNNVMFRYST